MILFSDLPICLYSSLSDMQNKGCIPIYAKKITQATEVAHQNLSETQGVLERKKKTS